MTLSNGLVLTFPVELRSVSQCVVTFTVRASDINKLLPSDLKAIEMGYGLAEMYLLWLNTDESDIGAYTEVQIGFYVRDPLYKTRSGYLFSNPVTSAMPKLVGREIWGIEKEIAAIDLTQAGNRITCRLFIDAHFVLSIESNHAIGPPCEFGSLLCIPRNGPSTVFRFEQVSPSCVGEVRPSSVKFALGEHPLSDTLRGLIIDDNIARFSYSTGGRTLMGPPLNALIQRDH